MNLDLTTLEPIIEKALVTANIAIHEELKNGITPTVKYDGSWVTNIDQASNLAIEEVLRTTDIPIVSEENVTSHNCKAQTYWLVDPIDGTSNLVREGKEFVTLIALMHNGRPVLGGIGVPMINEINVGNALSKNAWRINAKGTTTLRVRHRGPNNLIEVMSPPRSNKKKIQNAIFIYSGLKFVAIADGRADLYMRGAGLNDWDVAAGEALITAAGGAVVDIRGNPLTYGSYHRIVDSFYALSTTNVN
jgi:3'(2'), 5'-bisphosphate nucleotidase